MANQNCPRSTQQAALLLLYNAKRLRKGDDGWQRRGNGTQAAVIDSAHFSEVYGKPRVKSIGPKLIPFLNTVCIYFILWLPSSEPSWFSALIKCLPILSLGIFLLAYSVSIGAMNSYSKRILLGLLFSAGGDVCLIWPQFFLHGMVMFGIAHLLYITAFGMRPLKLKIFLVFALLGGTLYFIMHPYLQEPFLYTVGIYTALICIMGWRALARVKLSSYGWSWTRAYSAIGAITFMVSDCTLAVDRFCMPLPYARAIVMGTYYTAQMLIALSIIDTSTDYGDDNLLWKKK
ncbi:lysoplasmalogenase [Protopterus annectens]|uniref:lysoplasmalogenase n=1 Tax=Protopterus annectens TaxID=7888 RepID=UPI001CF99B16|nr:lysoplasmalogenase [Protopterus annectens]